MKPHFQIAGIALALVASTTVFAQQSASTLEHMTRRAPILVRAKVTTNRAQGQARVAHFEVLEALRGSLRDSFALEEPAQRHCGGSLTGLAVGNVVWAFLYEKPGRRFAPIGGSRGLVPANPVTDDAIRALLRVGGSASRLRLVAEQLGSRDTRVSGDAALAIHTLPGLESASATVRAKLRLHVAQEIVTGTVRPRFLHLLLAQARAEPTRAAKLAWSIVAKPPQEGLLAPARRVLLRSVSAATMASTMPLTSSNDAARNQRLAELLAERPDEATRATARRWLQNVRMTPEASVRAGAVLLALGEPVTALRGQIDSATLVRSQNLAKSLEKRGSSKVRLRVLRP